MWKCCPCFKFVLCQESKLGKIETRANKTNFTVCAFLRHSFKFKAVKVNESPI